MFNIATKGKGKTKASTRRPRATASGRYERHKARAAATQARQSAEARDIGELPPIKDLKRREACRTSLRLFCETYNPEAVFLAWSDFHLRAIARIEEAALQGALYAFAMPRGSGKSVLCRLGALWAISYGHLPAHARYAFIVGANSDKAKMNLESIKTRIRFLAEYAADFPEIAYPIIKLGGIANRASGQTCQGQPTLIQWTEDRVVLPTSPLPPNWPKDWPTSGGSGSSGGGLAPTSGSLIGVSGLEGHGIRGSVFTRVDGSEVRPGLVLLDDPQTDESAASPGGNTKREGLVSGAVLGMAGPGQSIAAVMPCTVIQPGDFVDRILDRSKHPLWRGERTRLLLSMPTNMPAWEKYFEIYRQCATLEPPDFTAANEAYLANREVLDAGAAASWPARKLDWEISAIQHAMHLYDRVGAVAFAAEYQNQPLSRSAGSEFLDASQIAAKVGHAERYIVPIGAQKLTAMIDVQLRLLYYAVGAWGEAFTGQLVDYGTAPDQERSYFTYADARRVLKADKDGGINAVIYAALLVLIDAVASRAWRGQDGGTYRVERILVDAGDGNLKGAIYKACRETPHAAIVTPSFGRGLKAGDRPLDEWKKDPGEQAGHNWRIRHSPKEGVKYALFDSNAWKTLVQQRLATPVGDPGSLTLYHADEQEHRMIADHLTAEVPTSTSGRGRSLTEWRLPPNKPDNHLLDCATGCAVAASIAGITALGHQERPKSGGRRRRATGAWSPRTPRSGSR